MDDTWVYQPMRDPKTCFLPTCPNTDLKNPSKKFFSIRKEQKEKWCKMVGRNCPKRSLFCCEDHINLKEDIENYEKWTSGAKPRLKISAIPKNIPKGTEKIRTKAVALKDDIENYEKWTSGAKARLKLSAIPKNIPKGTEKIRTKAVAVNDNQQLLEPNMSSDPVASTSRAKNKIKTPYTYDVGVQCKPVMRHVSVYGKPAVKSIGCSVNYEALDAEMLPRKLPQCACIQSVPCMSLSFTNSTKDPATPPSSSAAISKENTDYNDRNVSDWQDILQVIEEKADSYIGVSKCSLVQTNLQIKEEMDTETESISATIKIEYEDDQTESITQNPGTADSRPENLELDSSVKSKLVTKEESPIVTFEQFLKGCELYLTPELRDYVKNQVKRPI